nr:reverse transcriptase domain-containing protein [Tanacetum cinerariifolium]
MNLFMRHGKDIKISFMHQDSLNAAAGGNLLEKSHQDALTIIENKSKQTSAVTTAMTAMLKQFQSNPPPAQVKAVEEICFTCGGAHPYYQCLAAGGNTFPEFRDNIQGYVSAATCNYNQGNPGYRPQGVANQMRPPEQPYQATQSNQNFHLNELEKIKRMNDVSLKAMKNQIDMVKNELRNEMKTSIQTSLSNQTNEIKNMMASLLHMNTASTSGSGTLPGNTIANPKGKLKAITTRSGLVTEGPTVPNPPKSVNPEEDEYPGKFLIPCGFSELKCKALADLGASINLIPLSVRKKLGLPDLIPTRMTLELANLTICTPNGIARDVFVPVARALIDVHGKEMILRDGDERLTLNMKHDTASYSNHPHRDSVNLINIFNLPSEDCPEDLVSNKKSGNPTFSLHKEIASPEVIHEIHDSKGCTFLSEELPDIDSFNDIHPYFDDDPLSGSTTFLANSLLEEFTDELALITYPPDYDDNRTCDIEFDLREMEFLLYQGEDSNFKDSIDQTDLANRDDLFVDPTPEMFTDEQPPDYSFPPRFDVYPDDFLEIESDADTFDDDSFDSKREKIKEAELLIDQLDLPCDILSEYDSFNSQDFSRDDDLPSPDNEDKDFDPPFYELLVFKEVPNLMRLLPFSPENEEKVFKPGIYTFKKVKEYQENDKIRSKPDKNGKRGEAEKSQKQLQSVEEVKLNKM